MVEERTFCILVVDDEDDFRELLRFHFEDFGWEVLQAKDGRDALIVFEGRKSEIDLVITDIRMPNLDGEVLIRELQQRSPSLPIIGVTGHMDLQGRLRMMGRGAYFYMNKPIEHWLIVERLVENAVRFYRNQVVVEEARLKEIEIARLVRTYMVESCVAPNCGLSPGNTIQLDIAALPIERASPSGDFTEWFGRSASEICLSVSDFSGHGELLACFMACVASMVLHRAHHGAKPGLKQIVGAIDEAVQGLQQRGALRPSKYLTNFLAEFNLEREELEYLNAAHPAAFLFRVTGEGVSYRCERLESFCKPIGIPYGSTPEPRRVRIGAGDVLFVYTDGASELLQGGSEVRVGLDRLESLVMPLLGQTAREIVEEVASELSRVSGPKGLPDDTTLLIAKVLPAARS